MNEVNLDYILNELSSDHKDEILFLSQVLGRPLYETGKIASSIITRSELLLFGCSSPRFAYRLYFKDAQGFINIRRLEELGASISNCNEVASEGDGTMTRAEIAAMIKQPAQSCIADCLLPRPKGLSAKRFHVITSSLSSAYGETLDGPKVMLPSYEGTPFLKSITLGGGLCAQACAFMSSAILHDFATGIHGLAEITALAHSVRRKTLSISGLDNRLMARYFLAVALSMTEQSPRTNMRNTTKQFGRTQHLEFEMAIRAYCISNMPVIVPADVGRMLGFSCAGPTAKRIEADDIYFQNRIRADFSKFDYKIPHRHCFVVVGCEKNFNPGFCCFLFNDPAAHPFMWASTSQFLRIGTYKPPENSEIDSHRFFAVVPLAVRMPLLDFMSPGSFEKRSGLSWLSRWYRNIYCPKIASQRSDFQLIQIRDLALLSPFLNPLNKNGLSAHCTVESIRESLLEVARGLQDGFDWSPDHWIWLELMGETIWLWDAEIEPVLERPIECLVCWISIDVSKPTIHWPRDFEPD